MLNNMIVGKHDKIVHLQFLIDNNIIQDLIICMNDLRNIFDSK